ncbi:MAG: hypothetical protein M3416_00835 [Acidobacteriota bacterium]|nr:hypothetical protein [Acidobacteriota bacterium]
MVACVQLWTAATSELSPWKGGGFGMFSTVESPSSRIIRAYLITGGVKVPVQVPEQYRRLASQIRTKPSQPAVEELAAALAARQWATYNVLPTQDRYYRLHEKYFPGSPLPRDGDASRRLRHASDLNELFGQMQWVYMVRGGERADHPLEFESVEVECLQMKFDRARSRLVLEAVVRAGRKRHGNTLE